MTAWTYAVEVHHGDDWHPLAGLAAAGKDYCLGYLEHHRASPGPRLAMRIVRSNGDVIGHARAVDDVAIGQVAGFPTAEQYEAAAARALELARRLRELDGETPAQHLDARVRRLRP